MYHSTNRLPHRLLGVWAHPDDEAYLAAGLMGRIRDAGRHVTSVSATLGELGFADDDRRDLTTRRALRRSELKAALAAVGVHDVRPLDFPDGGLDEVPLGLLAEAVGALIDEVAPDAVVTFGPDGITGHPDHITIGRATTLAWRRRGSGRLLYATQTTSFLERYGRLHAELGIDVGDQPIGIDDSDVALRVVLGGPELNRKRLALGAHRSQTAPLIQLMGEALYREWVSVEMFRDIAPSDFPEASEHLRATSLVV